MKHFGFFIIVIALTASCAAKQQVVILNPDVSAALSQYQQSYHVARTQLEFENGGKVDTCAAYLQASKSSELTEDIANQMVKSEYLVCDLLSLLGPDAVVSKGKEEEYGLKLSRQLDLSSFSSSLHPSLDEKNPTLVSLPISLKIDAHSVAVESADWYFAVDLVAILDVDQNGWKDWVLWIIDESRTGNYRAYQTVIANDVDREAGLIRARPMDY